MANQVEELQSDNKILYRNAIEWSHKLALGAKQLRTIVKSLDPLAEKADKGEYLYDSDKVSLNVQKQLTDLEEFFFFDPCGGYAFDLYPKDETDVDQYFSKIANRVKSFLGKRIDDIRFDNESICYRRSEGEDLLTVEILGRLKNDDVFNDLFSWAKCEKCETQILKRHDETRCLCQKCSTESDFEDFIAETAKQSSQWKPPKNTDDHFFGMDPLELQTTIDRHSLNCDADE